MFQNKKCVSWYYRHPEKPNQVCWAELYKDEEAFLFHGKNPKLLEHVGKQADLQAGWKLEAYGTLKPEIKEFMLGFAPWLEVG